MLDCVGTMKLVSARLSKAGAPLVVLANRHAFIFNSSMCCWLRVADDTFPASNFVSAWPDADDGELANLQAGVAVAAGPSFLWNRLVYSNLNFILGLFLKLKHSLHSSKPYLEETI